MSIDIGKEVDAVLWAKDIELGLCGEFCGRSLGYQCSQPQFVASGSPLR